MSDPDLFSFYRLGAVTLANRLVMAPLTRNRAGPDMVPTELMAEYYGQRASAGLIITEASQVSRQGQGYQDTPGIYSDVQVAGWRKVTEAVHAKGGHIFLQLWHVGRVSHVDLQEDGAAPVAPSAIRAETKTVVGGGFVDVSEPRALELAEIPGIVDDFRRAAANAIAAGFDGVEVHGANGYLLDQFAKDGANHRTDAYGGGIANRARLMIEVTAAVAAEIGADRTGIRLSPVSPANGIDTSDPQPLFDHIVGQLDALGIAYIHVVEGATGGPRDAVPFDYAALRTRFRGTYIANNGFDRALAEAHLADGKADLIAFGRPFIANPDLVERMQAGAPLAQIDPQTLYGGGAKGYTDYPALANEPEQVA
ncbi:alkene reductase [Sphingomonas sp. Leaf25]|uniref:alkene reductase n=1 Tax=Sphingomonas sp. Leaf25 TaxID=1735692 RepID=UPI0006FEDA6E|nr:alkene reductase [Sphingomonas sp. Leaf25]KQN04082.1 alkene reductase [Sphingomonas sp. Leaf25]